MARRAVRYLALALSVFGLWVAPAAATGDERATAMHSLEQGVLGDVNALRRQHGLAALRLSPALAAAARQHSLEMARTGLFSHSSPNGSSFDRRIARFYPMAGRHYWAVGENLLWRSPDVDPSGALQMWLNSPEHRKILLTSRWREVGISAVHVTAAPGDFGGHEVTIVTADFGVRR
jgi:uncharacterized protein YkwD